jgi:hypothetical protein
MGILKGKTVSLADALTSKGQELRTKEQEDAAAAQALAVQSQEAAKSSALAAQHASAVERAIKILDDAGVTL